MKFRIRTVLIVLAVMCISPSIYAGSFNDSFKSWLLGPEANATVIKVNPVSLDSVSSECMQCHNGRESSHITIKNADTPVQFTASGQQSNHPVGMNYDKYVSSQPGSYRPRAMLNPKIRFAIGQVTCISCHELKDKKERAMQGSVALSGEAGASALPVSKKELCTARKTLTVGPRKSDLCMSCHNM